jgi:hypothetical protein
MSWISRIWVSKSDRRYGQIWTGEYTALFKTEPSGADPMAALMFGG